MEDLVTEIENAKSIPSTIPTIATDSEHINRQIQEMTSIHNDMENAYDLLINAIDSFETDKEERKVQLDLIRSEAEKMKTMHFFYVSDFSEGLAWVQYDDNGVGVTAAINTKGQIVFTVDVPAIYRSQFCDGLALLMASNDVTYTQNNGYTRPKSWRFTAYIIDNTGRITYTSGFEECILCYGDGKFVTGRHVSNFNEDSWTIGTIDKNGNTINDFSSYEWTFWGDKHTFRDQNFYVSPLSDFEERYKYVGEGIFILNGGGSDELFYYDTNNNSFNFKDGRGVSLFGQFTNGKNFGWEGANWGMGGENIPYVIDTKGDETGIRLPSTIYRRSIDKPGSGFGRWPNAIQNSRPKEFAYSEGLMYWDHSYVDTAGTRVLEITDYSDRAMFGGPFSGGYAVMIVVGADSLPYITVIDKSGNEQFPIRQVDTVDFNMSGGYVITKIENTYQILDMHGIVIKEITDNEGLTLSPVRDGFTRIKMGDNVALYGVDNNLIFGQWW